MKTTEFAALGKRLLPGLPSFVVKGQLLFMRPVGHTLRGVFFDRSSNPREFYVHIFIQPLFVPSEHVVFNLGWRLGGGCHTWNVDDPGTLSKLDAALKQEALPFLFRVQMPKDILDECKSLLASKNDPYTHQAIAYGFARCGEVGPAIDALERLVQLLDTEDRYPWQQQMAQRAADLKAKLQNDPQTAQRQLDIWESETTKNLGLEIFQ